VSLPPASSTATAPWPRFGREVKATARGQLRIVLQHIEGDDDGVLAEGALRSPSGTTPIAYVMQMRHGRIRLADTFVNPGDARVAWDGRVRAD
jgi:hypothetical protein